MRRRIHAQRSKLGVALALACLALAPVHARAEGSAQAPKSAKAAAAPTAPKAPKPGVARVARSFQDFCAQWLAKLDKRERFNQQKASRNGTSEYTAYGDVMIRCEAKPGRDAKNAIGRLVYQELRVRDAGEKAGQAAQDVLESVEVMEIFRFDGERWKY